jgi:MFS family permease
VLIVGMFMSILDVSIVNVAVPTIQKAFGTTTEDIQGIATAYSLALGVVVPVSGWLGDRLGFSRAYHLALLGFSAGSALCGVAWDLDSLVAFRVVQAIPGGILPVVGCQVPRRQCWALRRPRFPHHRGRSVHPATGAVQGAGLGLDGVPRAGPVHL